VSRSPSIFDGIKFVLWMIVLVGVLQAVSDRLFKYAGFDSFSEFSSCDFDVATEFAQRPEIERWLNDRRALAKNDQYSSPEYMGMKFVGPGLQVATGDVEVDKQNAQVLEFGLATKIVFPQYCFFDADVPQLAFVKFGFASVLFDMVRRDDVNNEVVAVIFMLTISAIFSISVWYGLLRLGTFVNVRSVFLLSLYSVTIWHVLIYVPQAILGIYYSFDESLSLHFDFWGYYRWVLVYSFASALTMLGFLFFYLTAVSQARLWKVITGTLVGASASCLLVPLVMVPILYLIYKFGYWLNLLTL